ncbi:MAG TPA: hypothetical protein PLH11_11215 [Gemmobacter sp.]|nr:hypothetical protein [Gemmobacter sp.]
MTDLAELERRIVAALARVDAGLDRLQMQAAEASGRPVTEAAAAVLSEVVTAADGSGTSDPWVAGAEPSADEQGEALEPVEASDAQSEAAIDAEAEVAPPAEDGALEALRAELAAEKAQVAALMERIRALKGRESRNEAGLQARIDQLTKQLDVQGLELHRLRKSMIQLREALRVLREGADGACVDAAMINKAMLAELEGLRAARSSETVELEEIIAELAALTGEEKADA